CLHYISSPWTF
nr:immunoglobulin light chain junction region [Macaca mulatta]MOW11277.1 immunoglobulin light chain junction region [Macaca mulatta]